MSYEPNSAIVRAQVTNTQLRNCETRVPGTKGMSDNVNVAHQQSRKA